MQKKKFVIFILVLTILLFGASILYKTLSERVSADQMQTYSTSGVGDATQTQSAQTPEQPMIDAIIYDKDENPIHLSSFAGKPIILNFWASWCGPCQAEMPDFQKMYEEYGDEIHFVMINSTDGSRETIETADSFIQNSGYTFPVYFDLDYYASYAYQAFSLPTTYFIDANGNVIAKGSGTLDRASLQRGIDYIYKP